MSALDTDAASPIDALAGYEPGERPLTLELQERTARREVYVVRGGGTLWATPHGTFIRSRATHATFHDGETVNVGSGTEIVAARPATDGTPATIVVRQVRDDGAEENVQRTIDCMPVHVAIRHRSHVGGDVAVEIDGVKLDGVRDHSIMRADDGSPLVHITIAPRSLTVHHG